jgi:hypothetical protein
MNLLSRRTALLHRLRRFRTLQKLYMPGLAKWLERRDFDDGVSSITPEQVELYFPSHFDDPTERASICNPDLTQIEDELRDAGANESLDDLCSQLRLRTLISQERETYRGSQAQFTRSHNAQVSVEDQIREHRDQYRVHRKALVHLRGSGQWEKELQMLEPEDIRGISERVLKDLDREIYRKASILAGTSVHEASRLADDILPSAWVPNLSVGDGKNIISWIWTSRRGTLKGSDGGDDGACSKLFVSDFIAVS